MKRFALLLSLALASLGPRHLRAAALSPEDREMLANGRISTGRYVGGGITGTLVGFGVGHAVVGHGFYAKRGWIFTVGELVGGLTMVAGMASCGDSLWTGLWYDNRLGSRCSSGSKTTMMIGMLITYGFRIWEIVDIWTAPLDYNDRYDQLKGPAESSISYYLMPLPSFDSSGLVWTAGITQRF